MRNTTIADCIISYLQRYPDYQRLFPFYCIISFQAWKLQEGKYNAYMEEMTTRKKTHKNAPNITETLKKPRIALFII